MMNKKLILLASAAMLTMNISPSFAGDIAGDDNCRGRRDDLSGEYYSSGDGTNCKWHITSDGVLIVERKDTSISADTSTYGGGLPWHPWIGSIKAVVFDGVDTSDDYYMGDFLIGNLRETNVPTVIFKNSDIYEGWHKGVKSIAKTCTGDINSCLLKYGVINCASSGQLLQEGRCVSSCGANFRLNDGECDRLRYTPAEAAAVLNDDNNTVTITFKK